MQSSYTLNNVNVFRNQTWLRDVAVFSQISDSKVIKNTRVNLFTQEYIKRRLSSIVINTDHLKISSVLPLGYIDVYLVNQNSR